MFFTGSSFTLTLNGLNWATVLLDTSPSTFIIRPIRRLGTISSFFSRLILIFLLPLLLRLALKTLIISLVTESFSGSFWIHNCRYSSDSKDFVHCWYRLRGTMMFFFERARSLALFHPFITCRSCMIICTNNVCTWLNTFLKSCYLAIKFWNNRSAFSFFGHVRFYPIQVLLFHSTRP